MRHRESDHDAPGVAESLMVLVLSGLAARGVVGHWHHLWSSGTDHDLLVMLAIAWAYVAGCYAIALVRGVRAEYALHCARQGKRTS